MHRRHLQPAENGHSKSDNHGSSGGPVSLSSATTFDTSAPVVATARPEDPTRQRRRKRNTSSLHRKNVFSSFYDPDGDGVVCIIIGLSMLVFFLIGVGIVIVVQLVQERPANTSIATFIFGGYQSVVVKPKKMDARLHNQIDGTSLKDKMALESSKIYEIPGSLSYIGDKSDKYASLRKEIDQVFPLDQQRSLQVVERLKKYELHSLPMIQDLDYNGTESHNHNPMPYDIYNCPKEPPEHYPYHWNTLEILNHWSPDDPSVRQDIHQGLCVFEYHDDYDTALTYRTRELPFVVRGDPSVAAVVERWNMNDVNVDTGTALNGDYNYMELMLGNVQHRAEWSKDNHFLFTNPNQDAAKQPKGWKEPTRMIRMTYADWLSHANVTDESLLAGPDQPHWYFRLIGCGETGPHGECDSGSSEYLFDELTFFQPTSHSNLYLVQPEEQKGIHCRFGMTGVIAENHFDSSRNAIVVLKGERRYILSPPDQCQNLALFPKGHPSARHSAVDWSDPDLEQFPQFAQARSNEVVLQAGDLLYLPTRWFHYIISLSLNYQCNTRSGKSNHYKEPIQECGF
jgi:hypothetical protein